jgi:hypothetical protein
MDLALGVSGAVAVLGFMLTLAFLPRSAPMTKVARPGGRKQAQAPVLSDGALRAVAQSREPQ